LTASWTAVSIAVLSGESKSAASARAAPASAISATRATAEHGAILGGRRRVGRRGGGAFLCGRRATT
jgi:hypothetical protein